MPLLGQLALWLALLLSVWGAVIGLAGGRHDRADLQESARRATVALAAALVVAVVALLVAVLRRDFGIAYVAAHADRTLASRDMLGVLLDGVGGRLLLCAAALTLCVAVVRHAADGGDRRALAYATGLVSSVVAPVVAVLLLAANPFARLSFTPIDGQGLGLPLQGRATQLQLASLCVGIAAAVVAVAWRFAARLAAHRAEEWDRTSRRCLVGAWVALTMAAALGLWTDYHADGWGGGWLAHALRGVALPAWAVVTLVLHSGARSPGRAGGYLAHAGGVLFALGLLGAAFRTTTDAELRPGESATVGPYSLTYLAASVYPGHNRIVITALMEARRLERPIGRLAPRLQQQFDVFGNERFAPAASAAIRGGLREDLHVLLVAAPPGTGPASFRFVINPFACWTWVGACLMAAGGLLTLWTGRRRT